MFFYAEMAERKKAMNKILKRRMMMLLMIFTFLGAILIPTKKTLAADGASVKITMSTDDINDDGTGVTEVDETLNRGNRFLEGLCRFVGIAVSVISALFFLISLPSHQADMRNQMIVAFFVGIIIIFIPEIVHAIAGK